MSCVLPSINQLSCFLCEYPSHLTLAILRTSTCLHNLLITFWCSSSLLHSTVYITFNFILLILQGLGLVRRLQPTACTKKQKNTSRWPGGEIGWPTENNLPGIPEVVEKQCMDKNREKERIRAKVTVSNGQLCLQTTVGACKPPEPTLRSQKYNFCSPGATSHLTHGKYKTHHTCGGLHLNIKRWNYKNLYLNMNGQKLLHIIKMVLVMNLPFWFLP